MASKKKKLTKKKNSATKQVKPAGSVSDNKAAATKKTKLHSQVEIREFVVEANSRSKKQVIMEVLKKEKHQSFERIFEIHILKNEKRKRLLYYVYELTTKGPDHLRNLGMEIMMPELQAQPEDVPGYRDILEMVKKSIDTFADGTLNKVKTFVWSQFGAAIDMLQNAIRQWPDGEWETDKRFFYIAYHTLIFLDYYLTDPGIKFSPKLSFTLTDVDARPAESLDDVIPDRIYSKTELLDYGELLRWKCKSTISLLSNDRLGDRWIEKDGDMNYGQLEILLYNMRHVQHHAAQLNMLLRYKIHGAPKWIGRAEDGLE